MTKHKPSFLFLLLFLLFSAHSVPLTAELSEPKITLSDAEIGRQQTSPTLIAELAVLAGLSLLPFCIMLLTSYIKIVIVLSLLRNALGVQQSPPNPVLNGIAILITIYVMFPTGVAMYESAEEYINQPPDTLFSSATAVYAVNVMHKAKEPLKRFLIRNTSPKHITNFFQLAQRTFPPKYRPEVKHDNMLVLAPAYITSQLKVAFEIGVLIYLPFFVIDLVTSNILLAMGMMMLSPLTIALPLKLLLLVMVDGWSIIIQGLAMSFKS